MITRCCDHSSDSHQKQRAYRDHHKFQRAHIFCSTGKGLPLSSAYRTHASPLNTNASPPTLHRSPLKPDWWAAHQDLAERPMPAGTSARRRHGAGSSCRRDRPARFRPSWGRPEFCEGRPDRGTRAVIADEHGERALRVEAPPAILDVDHMAAPHPHGVRWGRRNVIATKALRADGLPQVFMIRKGFASALCCARRLRRRRGASSLRLHRDRGTRAVAARRRTCRVVRDRSWLG